MPRRNRFDANSPEFPEIAASLPTPSVRTLSKSDEIQKFFRKLFLDRRSIDFSLGLRDQVMVGRLSVLMEDEHLDKLVIDIPEVSGNLQSLAGPGTAVFRWGGEVHVFPFAWDGTIRQEIPLPERIYIVQRRANERREIEKHKIGVKLSCEGSETILPGLLVDYGDRGFAVALAEESAFPIKPLDRVSLEVGMPPRGTFRVGAEVARITVGDPVNRAIIGLRITSIEDQESYWAFLAYLESLAFPDVRAAKTEKDFAAVWDVITAMHGVPPHADKTGVLNVWQRFSGGDSRIGQTFLYEIKGTPAATFSATHVYPKTWLLHTFALRDRASFALPLDMFRRIRGYVVFEKDAHFLCGLWPGQYRYMDRYYGAFVRQDFTPDKHHFETLRLVQFAPSPKVIPNRVPAGIVIGTMGKPDELFVRQLLRSLCTPVYLEATGLLEDDWTLSSLSQLYDVRGLKRGRKILVATRGKEKLGCAVLETGSSGQAILGVSNSFRVFLSASLAPGNDRNVLMQALVEAALAEYARAGATTCQLYSSEPWTGYQEMPGFVSSMDDVCVWFVHSSRSEAFLRHLERINWELGLFRNPKVRIRPSALRALEYEALPFTPRKTVRLEDFKGIEGVRVRPLQSMEKETGWPVHSLDTYGMSVVVPENLGLQVGDEMKFLMDLEGLGQFQAKGVVRNRGTQVTPGFHKTSHVLGLEFSDLEEGADRAILYFVYRRLNPDVTIFAPEDFEPLARLLERAKYFDYFETTDHGSFKEEARATYKDLATFYPDLVRTTVLRTGTEIVGTHSFYRVNSKTWQLHQLAVDPELAVYKQKIPTKTVLQSTFQYLCLDRGVEYFVTYFNDKAAIASAYFEAGKAHYSARDYAFLPHRWTFIENIQGIAGPGPKSRVSEAKESELGQISEALQSLVPGIEYEAMEFRDPQLKQFLSYWKQTHAERDRKVFAARDKQGELRVVALANLGPANANFLGVLDNFRLFEVPWCGMDTREMRLDLARKVLAYYASVGRKRVYFEIDENDPTDYSSLGVHDTGRTWRLIAHKRCFLTALQFFLMRYGKLEERLSAQKRGGGEQKH